MNAVLAPIDPGAVQRRCKLGITKWKAVSATDAHAVTFGNALRLTKRNQLKRREDCRPGLLCEVNYIREMITVSVRDHDVVELINIFGFDIGVRVLIQPRVEHDACALGGIQLEGSMSVESQAIHQLLPDL